MDLYNYFIEISGTPELAEKLVSCAETTSVSSGTTIQEAGTRKNYICLVLSGLVRGFYIDENGNDITKCFSSEGDWCCSYNYLSNEPCPFFIEAEADSILAKFDIRDLNEIKKEFPDFEEKTGNLLAKAMIASERRIFSFTAMEARDRYLKLLVEEPELIRLAKQEHIASYLGITPSSLSRIKRNL